MAKYEFTGMPTRTIYSNRNSIEQAFWSLRTELRFISLQPDYTTSSTHREGLVDSQWSENTFEDRLDATR